MLTRINLLSEPLHAVLIIGLVNFGTYRLPVRQDCRQAATEHTTERLPHQVTGFSSCPDKHSEQVKRFLIEMNGFTITYRYPLFPPQGRAVPDIGYAVRAVEGGPHSFPLGCRKGLLPISAKIRPASSGTILICIGSHRGEFRAGRKIPEVSLV